MLGAYEALARRVLTGNDNVFKEDRTGVGTISTFGERLEYDLSEGFPLITTKKVFFRGVVHELLWFINGRTNSRDLEDVGVNIWKEWADENGDLGPIYGYQWRNWPLPGGGHVDQLWNALQTLKHNPDSRRNIVSAWNVADLDDMALPPCHLLFQFYVAHGRLSTQVYQRSADVFLGLPFNIASYALLTHMMAQQAGLKVGKLVWVGGDVHVYANHFEQLWEQLGRDPYPFPDLDLRPAPTLFDYTLEHANIIESRHHPAIKAPVAV